MQIQNSILNVLPLTARVGTAADPSTTSTTSTTNPTATTDPTTALANETTFLQLMVAQLKNQDPLQPTDGAQFLGQLAQFSQLEQLMGIHQDLNTLSTPPPTTGTSTTGGTTTS